MPAGSEAMIKVGSETIAEAASYDSFFDLVRRFLATGDFTEE